MSRRVPHTIVLSFLAIGLILSLSLPLFGQRILYEDFSGDLTGTWLRYGSPLPGISGAMGNPAPSLYPNGDGSYDSGIISVGAFDFSSGLIMESDIYVTEAGGFDPGISFGLQNPVNRGLSRVGPGADYSVLFRYAWDSTGGWQGNIGMHVAAPGEYSTAVARGERLWLTQVNEYLNDWHRFRITVLPSGLVEFRVDGVLVFASTIALDESYNNTPLLLGRKRTTAFADNVLVVEGDHIIAQLMMTLGLDFAAAQELVGTYEEDALREALEYAGASLELFLEYLARPERGEDCPRLRIASIDRGEDVVIVVQNVGSAPCIGIPSVVAGLSYDTTWIPEWETHFYETSFPMTRIEPGEEAELRCEVPAVPESVKETLATRLEQLWTGYSDREPTVDYIGFAVMIGDLPEVFAFLPLE